MEDTSKTIRPYSYFYRIILPMERTFGVRNHSAMSEVGDSSVYGLYKNDNFENGIILFSDVGIQVLNSDRTLIIKFQDITKIDNLNLENKRMNDPFLQIYTESYFEKIFIDGNKDNRTFDIFEFYRFFLRVCKNLNLQ